MYEYLPRPRPFLEVDWSDRAACAGMDQRIFYLERGYSSKEAREICGRCPVRSECLEYALENKESFGLWGGTSERERRAMRRERRLRLA